ncbi:MAG: hypothetical protein AAF991_05675, partial [Pseudomonadota bacterium]
MTGGIDSGLPIFPQADSTASQESTSSLKSKAYGDSGAFGRVLDAQRSKSSDRDSKSSDSTARDTSSGNNLPTDRLDNAASSENSDNTSSDDYKTAASGNDTDVRDARQAESEQGYTSATSQKPDKNSAPGQRTDGRSSGLVKAAGL